ncbi:MAG: hypothetical protein U9N52_08645 [Campylobacterota bacterium]|nr:hypothetical protein [Campylobacterota bacterium]
MIKLEDRQVKAIAMLNNRLNIIESEIKQRGLKENQRAIKKVLNQKHKISGYKLEVEISVHYKNKEPVVTWFKDLKALYMTDNIQKHNCHIGDGLNHNTTMSICDNLKLHNQTHCWLLHSLYHHIGLSFENILNIDYLWYDIKITYQYVRRVYDDKADI